MTAVPDRLAATLADRYRFERELGQGGMATVYLAEDLKHKRKVALKVLKPELAAVLGAERFVQEITTTAALQHPHILPLFDSGEADGFLYYVMPYIQGETLRGKLDRETQLGIEESVKITVAVADALDYAHCRGVIHRDIKPENILLHDGRPMVADFGIALAVSAAAGGRMTETGLSLGTPHYMSPEQATAEKEISARSDVYSLGSVLYEMLTGNPPHTGASAQQIIMKIVTEEAAPVTKLRRAVPPNVVAAVAKALEKLPADRFESAKAFAEALENPAFTVGRSATARGAGGAAPRWNRLTLAWAAIAAVLLATTLWGWRNRTPPPLPFTRVPFDLGEIEVQPSGDLIVSRDGSTFAIVGTKDGLIYWRPAGEVEFRPIPGTENAAYAAFSPNGLELVYGLQLGPTLKRVALAGGRPQTMATAKVNFGGLDWGDGDVIVFTAAIGRGLFQVAEGGNQGTILDLDVPVRNPLVLPGGRQVLFTTSDSTGKYSTKLVEVATKSVRLVQAGALDAKYVEPGYLVYADESGTLWGARFDLGKGEIVGEPYTILDGVTVDPDLGSTHLAVAQTAGTLVFGSGGVTLRARGGEQLVEVAMDGTSGILRLPPRPIFELAIAPDNQTVAFTSSTTDDASGLHVYTYDMVLGAAPHLVPTDALVVSRLVWSPAGSRLAMSLLQLVPRSTALVIKDIDGGSLDRVLVSDTSTTAPDFARAVGWPTEDTLLIQRDGLGRPSLWHLVLSPDTALASEYLHTESGIVNARVARQRDQVVYQEAGVIWVSDYPNYGPPTRISAGRGVDPRWSPDGLTVYFWSRPVANGDWMLLAARLRRVPSRAVMGTDTIYRTPAWRVWDLFPDGQRFLVAETVVDSTPAVPVRREPFHLGVNFVQELKRLASK